MRRNNEDLVKKNLLNQLQKKVLSQSLHDVQSPLSAVSGYLELLQICLKGDKDLTKIDRYRQKIQAGVDEVSNIVNQIRYIENKSIADEESGDYKISLPWFLDDLCSHATSFAVNGDKKVDYIQRGDEYYLRNHIPLIRLFLYNIIVMLLKFIPKGETIKVSNENAETGFAITFTVDTSKRSSSEILNLILTNKSRSFSIAEEGTDDEPLHTMELVMKILNCTFRSESAKENGARISVVFDTISSSSIVSS